MPYRVDVRHPPDCAFDRLVELGALDVETSERGIAAIMPDAVSIEIVASALGRPVRARAIRGRDDGSVWTLRPRTVRVGRVQIVPADQPPQPGTLRLRDSAAFGTGLHPTTALCLEALERELTASTPSCVLDVGTGSGILALAALHAGVPSAVAVEIDAAAVRAAAANARLNGYGSRLLLVHGTAEAVSRTFPLVLANVIAASLIDMAPALARRVAGRGRLVLSGIRRSLVAEVDQAYRRVGMRQVATESRDGWSAVTLLAPW